MRKIMICLYRDNQFEKILGSCLVAFKIPKLYKIPHHIESLNACMKY